MRETNDLKACDTATCMSDFANIRSNVSWDDSSYFFLLDKNIIYINLTPFRSNCRVENRTNLTFI